MRFLLLLLWISLCVSATAQGNARIFTEKEDGATVFYADNNEYGPVSLEITLTLNNMESNGFSNGIFVLPPLMQRLRLFTLQGIRPRRKTTYSYTYRAVLGDVKQVSYDSSFRYDLPYRKNARYRIEQGYHGKFSHQYENSLDFNLSQGSEVRAARGGIVISVIQQFNASCLREECKGMANRILILHNDGTIAEYSHLSYNSARVSPGDSVAKGRLLAFSGNTGYTRGPHLHFICYLAGFDSPRSVRTLFRTGKGSTAVYLQENKTYLKGY